MADKKPYRYLNALLAKTEFSNQDFRDFLAPGANVDALDVLPGHEFEGMLYVKNPQERRPRWTSLIDAVVGRPVDQLTNKSSSAILLLRIENRVLALTFGYGRFLLDTGQFEQNFGLKTALNTLNHKSLRSVDLHTLEDQPIQKKSQAVRDSDASVFGIDIFRDVLRAVTGSPRAGIGYKNISGGDAIFSFGLELLVEDLPAIARQLVAYYEMELYKTSFAWVDNIRRVKDNNTIQDLDALLLEAVKKKDPGLVITIPEIIQWDRVLGFSFTRSKKTLSPILDSRKYLDNIDIASISIESIKKDRLYVTDVDENVFNHSIYTCLYLELDTADTKMVIFGGSWYEIDKSFMGGIEATLATIQLSDLDFPSVRFWEENNKRKIEAEGDYNVRAALHLDCHLLDRKLVKCSTTTSPIELCDLLTADKQLIHVKHRKGGSAGLSHLFAQGGVASEVLIGDKTFRKEARKVLRKVHQDAPELVPLDAVQSAEYEIVFLILGDENAKIKENLPFFSKVNLARTYDNLTQKGFRVRVGGAELSEWNGP